MLQTRVSLLLMLLLAIVGCASDLHVASIQLGRSLNADSSVASHTTSFGPQDTVYVSVLTAGVGSGTVGVRWTYAGRVMGEPKKTVKGAAATEFHLQSAGGFPLGEYTVEVFLDGQSVGTKTFRVENRR